MYLNNILILWYPPAVEASTLVPTLTYYIASAVESSVLAFGESHHLDIVLHVATFISKLFISNLVDMYII